MAQHNMAQHNMAQQNSESSPRERFEAGKERCP